MPSAGGGGGCVVLLLVAGRGGDGAAGDGGGGAGACAVASATVSFGGRMMGGRSSPAIAFLLFFLGLGGDVDSALMRGMEDDWLRRLLLVVTVGFGGGEVRIEGRRGGGGEPGREVR